MAAVATVAGSQSLGGTSYLYWGTIAFDSSYPTGGEAIDVGQNESIDVLFAQGSGYVYEWNQANQKLLVYRQKDPANAGGADIALPQVSNTADLSGITAAPFMAIGQ